MKMKQALTATLALLSLIVGRSGIAQNAPTLTPAAIDHLIRAQWKQEGILPAPPVDDARYLRRIYLDIIGTIPPPEAVTKFLADKSPDKRARAVDELLASPRYADHWAGYWDNVLMGRQVRSPVVDRTAFRQWLRGQFDKNVAWNKFVYDLITASGQNSVGGTYAQAAGLMARTDAMKNGAMTADAMKVENAGGSGPVTVDSMVVNGAVNWTLKYTGNVQDLSGTASKLFLGVQIQCAQCHDHKTEKWKQEDFRKFTACFVNARPRPVSLMQEKGMMRRVDLEDVNRPIRRLGKKALANNAMDYVNATPAALDGTDFADSRNRRQALAAWMTAPENPWFNEAIVNRMWSHFLGRGFVEPIDDFRPSNPPNMPELLKALADDFKANNSDLKHLIRTICATQVYQLSAAPAKKADPDNKYWARFRLKPMGPDELLDSLVTATNLQPVLERVAGEKLDQIKFLMQRQFTFLFDVDEEFEQKDFEGTIPQALMLLNGNIVSRGVMPIPGTAQADIQAMTGTDAQKIEALYLRTLSRKPTVFEVRKWTAFVNAPRDVILDNPPKQPTLTRADMRQQVQAMRKAAGRKGNGGFDPLARVSSRLTVDDQTPKKQAYEDLFWTLLNSSEFMFNH